MRQEILARPGGSVTEGCRDGLVNDVAFTKSLVCVCVCISTQSVLYGTVTLCPLCGEIEGTCRQVRESFLCADRLARARVSYEACGVDPQAV